MRGKRKEVLMGREVQGVGKEQSTNQTGAPLQWRGRGGTGLQ